MANSESMSFEKTTAHRTTFQEDSWSSAAELVETTETEKIKVNLSEEKRELKRLNYRFIEYISKINSLHDKNESLATQIKEVKLRETSSYKKVSIYEKQLSESKTENEKISRENAEVKLQLHGALQEIKALEMKIEAQINEKKAAESKIVSLQKIVDDANIFKADMEFKLSEATKKFDLTEKIFQGEIKCLETTLEMKCKETSDARKETMEVKKDIQDIKVAHKKLSIDTTKDLEKTYKATIEELQKQLRTVKAELSDDRNTLVKTRRNFEKVNEEIVILRRSNSTLQNQIADWEEKKVKEYLKKIEELESQVHKLSEEKRQYLADRNGKFESKNSLLYEIQKYRKLLESEERRIQSGIEINIHGKSMGFEATSTGQTTYEFHRYEDRNERKVLEEEAA